MKIGALELILGGAAVYLLLKQSGGVSGLSQAVGGVSGVSGASPASGASPVSVIPGANPLYAGNPNAARDAASLERFIRGGSWNPNQSAQLSFYQTQLAGGADPRAIASYVNQAVSQPGAVAIPLSASQVAYESSRTGAWQNTQAVMTPQGGGYYNPYTGATYIPQRY